MYTIKISDTVSQAAPSLRLAIVQADVINTPTGEALKAALDTLADSMASVLTVETIKDRPGIAATRAAYKALGKDPNRYRPSHEQLTRRIVRGLGLYNVDSLVDTGNLVSLTLGCSVGVFDSDKIVGDVLTLGRGEAAEPYEGIGRGTLNIEGLPVLRDSIGGIGTPTSDNERTKVSENTRHILVVINMYSTDEFTPEQALTIMSDALTTYCSASNIVTTVVP